MNYFYKTMKSPIGELKLVARDQVLSAILWENDDSKRAKLTNLSEDKTHPTLLKTEAQLREYFAGKRKKFDLDLDFQGTEFQKKVWQILLNIPYGETKSYGQVAKEIGNPKASRAVGAANGKNPIAIIAACHRVIGSSGKLTGFAGGLEVKAYLLELEKNNL